MENKGLFQTVLMVVFGALMLLAAVLFIVVKPKNASEKAGLAGTVNMWGTISNEIMDPGFSVISTLYPDLKINYRYIKEKDFERTFVDALAAGTGPDMIAVTGDEIMHQRTRLYVIPQTTYPAQQFDSTFADVAKPFLLPWGVVGLPFAVDPLVMYYNKDLLNSAYIIDPAKTWTELEEQIPKLTIKNDIDGSIIQSAVALGTYNNVKHADDILSMFVFQSGGTFVTYKEGAFTSGLRAGTGDITKLPVSNAFSYYLSYADPTNPHFTWSTGRLNSFDSFVAGDLVYYFGLSSEYNKIAEKNPNLNFDMTMVPQLKDSRIKAGAGKVYGAAIVRTSPNATIAYNALNVLASKDSSLAIAQGMNAAPVLRSSLSVLPKDLREESVFKSAIIAREWWKPSQSYASEMFSNLINKVQSGLLTIDDSISLQDTLLSAELAKIKSPIPVAQEDPTANLK